MSTDDDARPTVRERMTAQQIETERAALRRGWCPDARRAMRAADGAIMRVRPYQGRLGAGHARVLADLAESLADGYVLLTRRGKLELRGIEDSDAVADAFARAGFLEPSNRADLPDRVLAPATDLDACADADAGALADALDARLIAAGFGVLPAKFCVVVDGGGQSHVGDVRADIRLDAVPSQPARWRVALGGDAVDALPLCDAPAADVPARVVALLERLLAGGKPHRFLNVAHARLEARFADCVAGFPAPTRAIARPARGPIGRQTGWQAAAFPFGRLSAAALRELAALADNTADGMLRLTPQRSVILARDDAEAQARLRASGAIVSTDDPRHGVIACSGAPGCPLGTTPTREHALRYAAVMPHLHAAATGAPLHVSGCIKACARRAPALVTLVARDGRYDVIVNGAVTATPLWCALSPDEAEQRLTVLDQVFHRHARAGESGEAFCSRVNAGRLRQFCEEATCP